MKKTLAVLVRQRAAGRCEYCGFVEKFARFKFQIEHIIARQHGGGDVADNLAIACGFCNLHKEPNLSGIDPQTGAIVELFHPRRQVWSEHLAWEGAIIKGPSSHGRATVFVLSMNDVLQIARRQALLDEGVLAPPS
jgi:hypothetical protein